MLHRLQNFSFRHFLPFCHSKCHNSFRSTFTTIKCTQNTNIKVCGIYILQNPEKLIIDPVNTSWSGKPEGHRQTIDTSVNKRNWSFCGFFGTKFQTPTLFTQIKGKGYLLFYPNSISTKFLPILTLIFIFNPTQFYLVQIFVLGFWIKYNP